jgi:hypothetical protein
MLTRWQAGHGAQVGMAFGAGALDGATTGEPASDETVGLSEVPGAATAPASPIVCASATALVSPMQEMPIHAARLRMRKG